MNTAFPESRTVDRRAVTPKGERPTVVVADDHPLIGSLLGAYLNVAGGFRLVGTATTGVEALELCRAERPDMLILDLVMPGLSGVEVLRALKSDAIPTRALVFTSLESPEALQEAMANGAYGFVAKSTPFADIIHSLNKVRGGEFAFTPQAMELLRRWVVSGDQAASLSDVETTVLRRVALGHSAKEISSDIKLSESGTYRLIERVKQKLRVQTLQELTLIAVRRGLLPL